MQRREFLKTAAAGALAVCVLRAQKLNEKLTVIDGGGANVLAFSTGDGLILVDTGAPKSGDKIKAALNGAEVQTVFNTHYHTDQTGNNEMFAAAGAKIIAHRRTKEWMSVDYWVPQEERYERRVQRQPGRPRRFSKPALSKRAGNRSTTAT